MGIDIVLGQRKKGKGYTVGDDAFTGLIDDVVVWKRSFDNDIDSIDRILGLALSRGFSLQAGSNSEEVAYVIDFDDCSQGETTAVRGSNGRGMRLYNVNLIEDCEHTFCQRETGPSSRLISISRFCSNSFCLALSGSNKIERR